MNTKTTIILIAALLAPAAAAQTMYRCPNATGVVNYQQTPCTPQGGGEAVPIKAIPSGSGSGLSDEAKAYLEERNQYRAEQAKAAEQEQHRQDALAVEHRKARAEEAQAAAQRDTAAAIWATGRIR